MTSFAYAYLNEDYASIYVNLPGQDQLIFYWNILTNEQRRQPRLRVGRETQEHARIISYTDFGCVVEIGDRRAVFTWTEFNNPDNQPAHRGRLENWAEWEYADRPDYQHDSPTSQGPRIPVYTGHYAEPQPYEEDE